MSQVTLKRRLYGVGRLALAAAALLVVVAGGMGAGQTPMLPMAPTDGSASDPLDAYLMGMWHLSLAAGRTTCQGVQLSAELRSLTARDILWTERGTHAAVTCGKASQSAYLHPIELHANGLTELRARLDTVRADYQQLAEPSQCWHGQAGDVVAISNVLFSVGQATAAAACAIASWNRLQSPLEADAVRSHLHAARTTSAAMTDRSLRNLVDARLKAVLAQVDKESGETLYHALVGVFEATRTELRKKK